MDSRVAYTAVVAGIAVERLLELVVSRRNELWLRARGAVEHGVEHYPWMVALHAAFLAGCLGEVWALGPPLLPPLAVLSAVALLASVTLRWWVIATLGRRWCTRVLVLPGVPLVRAGPFRYMRHPNYAAVVAELLALPLLHTAVLSALVFGVLNGWLLSVRMRVEDAALRAAEGAMSSSADANGAPREDAGAARGA